MDEFDVIVIGGGAAGLSAALMLGRSRRRVAVIDAGEPRNRFAAHMHGVLGRDATPPGDLLAAGRAELARYDVTMIPGRVDAVRDAATPPTAEAVPLDGGPLVVGLDDGRVLSARAVVLATGIRDRLPGIPGLAERWGDRILHCPYCHGWEVRGRRLGVLATGPMSLHQVQLVRQLSESVVLLDAGVTQLDAAMVARLEARGVVVERRGVQEVGAGAEGALRVVLEPSSGGAPEGAGDFAGVLELELDAIFTGGAPEPLDEAVAGLGLARRELGPFGTFLEVDASGRTSDPRVWAAGNVVDPGATVPVAMAAGSMTGARLNALLVEAEFDAAAVAAAVAI